MAASNYYSPQPDVSVNTDVDPVTDAPMVVGNPALSRRSQKKSNKNALMIGIPVAAVLIAGLGAAVMMSDKGSSPGGATTTQTSQTTTTASTAPAAAPAVAAPTAPVPVHAAANTMDATPPVTQSAEPTPVRHAAVRHLASRSARTAAPSAEDSSADVNATVPVNPPAATTPSVSTVTPPPVVSAPPPAATPQAGQPVNPAPETTTTQP